MLLIHTVKAPQIQLCLVFPVTYKFWYTWNLLNLKHLKAKVNKLGFYPFRIERAAFKMQLLNLAIKDIWKLKFYISCYWKWNSNKREMDKLTDIKNLK